MEVKLGYKQIEVGVIPQEWESVSLEAITNHIADGLHGTPVYSPNGEYFFINGNNLNAGKLVITGDTQSVTRSEFMKHRKPLNDRSILMSINGTIGNLGLFSGEPVVLGKSVAYLNVKPGISKLYVYHSLQTQFVKQQFFDGLTGSTIGNLGLGTIRRTKIFLPPNETEQRAIAEALSDVDGLLGGLERLIAKKRDLQQAAMQQLLTGKTRLPGFHGDWEVKPLSSEIADLEAGVSVNSEPDKLESSRIAILKTSAVANGRFIPTESKPIVVADIGRAKLTVRAKSIIISRMNTIDLVGECAFVEDEYKNLFVPDRLWMTRLKIGSMLSTKWLAFALNIPSSRQLITSIATGTSGSMKNIAKSKFLSIKLPFPPPDEQCAIASTIADMDSELQALEARRDKTHSLKQGMMQELLTGKTRLVPASDPNA